MKLLRIKLPACDQQVIWRLSDWAAAHPGPCELIVTTEDGSGGMWEYRLAPIANDVDKADVDAILGEYLQVHA